MGRSPEIVEQQITYPISSALQGLPEVKAVRASSMFGMSFVFVIFNDNTDLYLREIVSLKNSLWFVRNFHRMSLHSWSDGQESDMSFGILLRKEL